MTTETRLVIRAIPADLAHADAIAQALRSPARPKVTRTDAVRYALATVAATMTGAVEALK